MDMPDISSRGPVAAAFQTLRSELSECIIGQKLLVDRLLIALLADGHLLVEGAPGLAKTTAIKELSARIEGDFHRIQFTPDLLPADLTGTEIYRPQQGTFEFQRGPIFHNLLLADEINRAPAKVQSALLEAMGERQVTVGRTTYALPALFLVMATQNPIEQEGTYPLPEAQLDRFLMHIRIDYPDASAEADILKLARVARARRCCIRRSSRRAASRSRRSSTRANRCSICISRPRSRNTSCNSRSPRAPGRRTATTSRAGSPTAPVRAAPSRIDRCSRARAWLHGRDFVTPDDVHAVAHDVLRHRVLVSYEAEAEGITSDKVIDALLQRVPLP